MARPVPPNGFSMEVVVDVQAFKYDNYPIFKELAYAIVNDDAAIAPSHWVFRPPISWNELPAASKRINIWLTNYFHGMEWSAGNTLHREHAYIIRDIGRLAGGNNVVKIYVKGAEKVQWISRYVDYVYNIEDMNCPSLHEPGFRDPIVCSYHRPGWTKNCAVQNVNAMKRWLTRTLRDYGNHNYSDDDEEYYTSDTCSLTLSSDSDDDMYRDYHLRRVQTSHSSESGYDTVD